MEQNTSYQYLYNIHSPEDVKALSRKECDVLEREIRDFLVESVTRTGGHLASNLGVVELSVALARVFSTPKDHIIFDVGHQSYVHKLLTGRLDRFDTLRRGGGLCGFTKRSESEHDCFGAGHSSTSVSAALGFAQADKLSGSDAYTVAVMGDGAFTGGMIHEALNNCDRDLRLIIVINENEMSISKNIGHFAESLSKIRSSRRYFLTKQATAKVLHKIPLIGKWIFRALKGTKTFLKNLLYGSNYFEKMGLYYLGPVDGNDGAAVEELLRIAKEQTSSVVVHVKTKKGKGYEPAEQEPDRFHGLSPAGDTTKCGFSRAFGEALCELAEKDGDVLAITAAMCSGTGLDGFREKYPDRFFDVGIAEPHAVTFAAGLAANGKRPVVALYSTFLQRSYDNIIHDVALQGLPVCLCIDRAGLNPADGPTHHGIFDVAFLSEIPHVKIYTPPTYAALRRSLAEALSESVPTAIRYPRGSEDERVVKHFYADGEGDALGIRFDFAKSDAPDAVIVTHGKIVTEAMRAKEVLAEKGIRCGIALLEVLKPYDRTVALLAKEIPEACPVVTLEEEIRSGGMGVSLLDQWRRVAPFPQKTAIMALDDSFAEQTRDEDIYKTVGLDADSIARTVVGLIE